MNVMKYLFAVFSFLSTFSLLSCNYEEEPLEEIENEIEYIVTCQSPDAEFKVDATGLPVEGIYAKSEFCYKCMTKDYFAVIKVTCKDDPHALLKVSLFVNGKYKGDYYGNQSAFVSERLKGTGPYLQ